MRGLAGVLLVVAFALGACGGGRVPDARESDSGISDIERTWNQALVALPSPTAGGTVELRRMVDVKDEPPRYAHPPTTIIYLHGCTGIGDVGILRFLAGAGYLVIAPNSMARHFRPLQCDAATGRGGFNLFVYDFRATELSFAIHNIQRLPWVDAADMFLIGGSEGGVTAALYRGDAFRGRIIAAWTCHGAPIIAGLEAPASEPVLSIVSVGDPWYSSRAAVGQSGDCGAYMMGRPNARSLVLPAEDGHAVLNSVAGRQAILDFLALWRKPRGRL
ncbi:MAG: hypothetical protein PHS60_11600 [Zavarzinia sp.]|nr:hypothetical protein [Zavarzinia sp.]